MVGRSSEVVTAASWFCRCAPCSDFSSTGTLLSTRTSKLVEMSSWAATSARADLGRHVSSVSRSLIEKHYSHDTSTLYKEEPHLKICSMSGTSKQSSAMEFSMAWEHLTRPSLAALLSGFSLEE